MPLLVMAWVPGRPKTKGSMELVNGRSGAMRESVAGSSKWRQMVAKLAAENYTGAEPYAGPCRVRLMFYLPVADAAANRSGDLDKLTRNVFDALEDAKVWVNDAQAVEVHATKTTADRSPREGPGVWFNVVGLQ